VSFSHEVIVALLKREFDVLVLSNDILGVHIWLCAWLKRWFGVRVILWGQAISKPDTPLRVWLRRQLMSRSDACLFYGDDARETWIGRGLPADKLFVAYNALDTDVQSELKARLGPAELQDFRDQQGLRGKRVFLYSGRLVTAKRPDFAVRTLAKVLQQVPNAHLVVIGDGPERQRLEAIIASDGLGEHCTLAGAVYDEEVVARFMLISRAVVVPAWAGLTVQHAFAYGVPVVLAPDNPENCPEAKLVIDGETGLFFPDGDLQRFAQAITRLLMDNDLHARLSGNAEAVIATKYNKQSMAAGILAAVRYVLDTKSRNKRARRHSPNLASRGLGR
jgi:glycosyltransferase involved in cell wall biosynthesis